MYSHSAKSFLSKKSGKRVRGRSAPGKAFARRVSIILLCFYRKRAVENPCGFSTALQACRTKFRPFLAILGRFCLHVSAFSIVFGGQTAAFGFLFSDAKLGKDLRYDVLTNISSVDLAQSLHRLLRINASRIQSKARAQTVCGALQQLARLC